MLTSDIRETVNNHVLTHTLLRIYIYVLIYIIRRNSRNSIFFANISKYCSKYFTIFRKKSKYLSRDRLCFFHQNYRLACSKRI